jgi:hypothetical protein
VRRDEGGPEFELCQPGSVACCLTSIGKTFGFSDKHGRVVNVRTQEGGRSWKVELLGAT